MFFTGRRPLPDNINNGVLKGQNAMPLKDGVSSGGNVFSMNRRTYARLPSYTKERELPVKDVKAKKWYGNSHSRDASILAKQKGTRTIGNVSKVPGSDGNISYTTHKDINDSRQALHRVRSGGATVPSKVAARRTVTGRAAG